jgi:HD-GYP domain-containing protein (c-di-GMP phosphodiesterase class II)
MSSIASLPSQANQHYLKALSALSAEREIQASEDVYSQNGMKLIARGTRVTPNLYERVVQHKLATQIERAIVMCDPNNVTNYAEIGSRLLEENPLVHTLCAWSNGRVTPLGMLEQLKFNAATQTVLTVSQQRTPQAIEHDVMVSMLAMGLANAYRYSDNKLLAQMALGGLFHDVGEAYVDPELLKPARQWKPREWITYSAHPIIGAALAREIAGLDADIQRAILEHHEQSDGHGYPRYLLGPSLSLGGNILSLADELADFATKSTPNRRISIALRLLPEEFPSELTSVVLAVIGFAEAFSSAVEPEQNIDADVHAVFVRLADVMTMHDALAADIARLSAPARKIVDQAWIRFARIQQAFASTGVGGINRWRKAPSRNCGSKRVARLTKLAAGSGVYHGR